MIDIIITFVASEGVPALILYILAQRTGFVSDGTIISALTTLGGNNVLTGLIVLELIQVATIILTLWGIKQVICDLFFQEAIEHSDDFKASMEAVRELPVSPIMHAMVIKHIISHHHSLMIRKIINSKKKKS